MLKQLGLFQCWRVKWFGFEISENEMLDRVKKLCIMRTSSLLLQRFFKKMNNR